MNKNILNKLLVCTLVLSIVGPTAYNASEVTSEVMSGTASEVTSEDAATESEVASEDTATESEVASEDTATESEVASEDTATESEVASEDTATESEVASEDTATESEVASEDTATESEVTSEDTEDKGILTDSFYIWTNDYNDEEITSIGQTIDGGFIVDPATTATIKSGATISLSGTEGFTFNNLTVGLGDETESTPLLEGEDYSIDGQTITMLRDFDKYEGIVVTYDETINTGSTDVLGATSTSYYTDVNENDVFDEGIDYMVSSVGYNIEVTNGTESNTKSVNLDTDIAGGELSLTGADASIEKTDGTITANASFDIENTGDYAIKISSISAGSALTLTDEYALENGGDEGEKYVAVYTDEDYTLTVDGVEVSAENFTSTKDEYLDLDETLTVDVTYTADEDRTELAIDEFGSFDNLVNNSEAYLYAAYGRNVFGNSPDEYTELATTIAFPTSTVTDPDVDTDTDVDSDTDVDTDTTVDEDDSYSQMSTGAEDNTESLATTGSKSAMVLFTAMLALVVAVAAKFKFITK